jgi:hypothetical protein
MDIEDNGGVSGGLNLVEVGNFFVFERGEEALGRCIVPAVILAARARHEAVRGRRLAEVATGVLAAPVGVEQSRPWTDEGVPHLDSRAD